MTLKALEQIGTELDLTFTKNHSRQKRARMILDRYAALDLAAADDAHDVSPSSTDPLPLGDPKPEFERLIDADSAPERAEEGPPQRGGDRPGAGRPEGVTEDVAAYNRLAKIPHPFIQHLIEKAFTAWADRIDCPEVKLKKEQAVALGLAWTHVYNITPIGGRLPVWVVVLFEAGWSTYYVLSDKAGLAREAAKQKKLAAAAAGVN